MSDRDFAEVNKLWTRNSSVSIDNFSKTDTFKKDLDVLKRIHERSEGLTPAAESSAGGSRALLRPAANRPLRIRDDFSTS